MSLLTLFTLLAFTTPSIYAQIDPLNPGNGPIHEHMGPFHAPFEQEFHDMCRGLAAQAGKKHPEHWAWSKEKNKCVHGAQHNTWKSQHLCEPYLQDFDEWLQDSPIPRNEEIPYDRVPKPKDIDLEYRCAPLIRQRLDAWNNVTSPDSGDLVKRQIGTCTGGSESQCIIECSRDMHNSGQSRSSGIKWAVCMANCGFNCPSERGGCYKGYCWAGCTVIGTGTEWCYTTKGYSQDYGYVRCSSDSECNLGWRCAGSCTV